MRKMKWFHFVFTNQSQKPFIVNMQQSNTDYYYFTVIVKQAKLFADFL